MPYTRITTRATKLCSGKRLILLLRNQRKNSGSQTKMKMKTGRSPLPTTHSSLGAKVGQMRSFWVVSQLGVPTFYLQSTSWCSQAERSWEAWTVQGREDGLRTQDSASSWLRLQSLLRHRQLCWHLQRNSFSSVSAGKNKLESNNSVIQTRDLLKWFSCYYCGGVGLFLK